MIRAFHWRGAPDEEAAEAAVREHRGARRGRRARHPLGPQGARGAAAGRAQQGPRACGACIEETPIAVAAYVGDDTTDLDAFAALRALVEEKQLEHALCVGVRSDETPRRARGAGRPARRRPAGRADPAGRARRVGCGRVRFVDLLRITVLLSAGAATALAIVTVLGATAESDDTVVFILAGWWFVAALDRRVPGPPRAGEPGDRAPARRREGGDDDARAPARARSRSTACGRCCCRRSSRAALGLIAPQIPGIATGFAIIWALAWRRQESAVRAIEERDGVTFYVEPSSPFRPLRLVRTPGFRREVPTLNGTGV